ncbi:hypothetical protein BU23DRAFT_587812 [Bimuria novae-zelandiae CBS 107.79]|uniref:Rhodopsin domain-containing protein n=1 Tax=Bimuria novae-zelandiae CBS 107.79 TaxID=1447943 RepID=A0A6A5VGV7_9PLEO|nr:hypothetical protein BU23DRAFT_587812 [Bimuria novae-zelandiae CBS 107.79]
MADQVVVIEFNRTPIVQIVTWICLVISILAFFSHASMKFYLTRSFTVETGLLFMGLLFGSAQSIVVSLQASYGFGKPSNTLDNNQLQTVLKCEYADTLLFLCSIAFSKLAVVAFVNGITPGHLHQRSNYAAGAFSVVWLVVSVLIVSFQCQVPHTWDKTSGICINTLNWWLTITILNILSEVALVALEIALVAPVQMMRKRKVFVIGLFTCRLLVSIAAAFQLYLFWQDATGPLKDDYALGYWRSTTGNQVVLCLAIITTSLPYAKIFMESFESGLIRIEKPRGLIEQSLDGEGTYGSGRTYELLEVSRKSGTKPPCRNCQAGSRYGDPC